MSTTNPDPERCAEVIAGGDDGAVQFASGYRVSTDLILTVAHVLHASTRIQVRIGGKISISAELEWCSQPHDLAVLRIPGSFLVPVEPIRVGILPDGSGQVPFRMIGYPKLATRGVPGDELRDTWQVDGTIQLGSDQKSGLLGLGLDSAPPDGGDPGAGPWSGISGAAVFSQPGGELVGVAAGRLLATGTGNLDAQPVAGVTDPTFRRALESAGIGWQEIETGAHEVMPPILSHNETLARLSGFRTYLTSERLRFVSPGPDHPSAPEVLFARLSQDDPEHLLLQGRPGSGKTRTCYEVARIAEENGWRVFHVQHNEPLASNGDLAKAILAARTPALVIIDTLAECQGLDLDGVRTRLSVEAQHRKVSFALLATVRPGQFRIMSRSRDFKTNVRTLFRHVEMRQDKNHLTAIRDAILEQAAPRAIARYGHQAVAGACGQRPVLTLLIATEIERRLDEIRNPLERPFTGTPGLVTWLCRRLDEDQLAPAEPAATEDLFAEPTLTPELLACAALAAACPLPRAVLTLVAERALAGAGADPAKAPRILDLLLSVGWLEGEGKTLSVVHDLVSDVLLQRVLLPDEATPIADGALHGLLDASLAGTRAFSRFATALSRALRDIPDSDAEGLQASCAEWLSGQAGDVAAMLSRSPAYEGGQAVAALLGSSVWTEVAIEHWDVLIAPWLKRHRQHREARHLLYLSLSRMPDRVGAPLVLTALRWLQRHGGSLEASFIIQALLRWRLDEQQQGDVRRHIRTWLHAYAEATEARWLLSVLLRPQRMSQSADAAAYAAAAQRWLARHGRNIDAFLLIARCLDARQPELARQAARSGTDWLALHSSVPDAAEVLIPLLRRTTFFTPDLRAYTLKWLDRHALTRRGPLVIKALLGRDHILDANARSVAVRKAADWLETQADSTSGLSRDLLTLMLSREDPDVAIRIITLAMAWIEQCDSRQDARQILKRLLRRKDLPVNVRRIGAERTLQFIRGSSSRADMSVLLAPLLKDADPAVRAAARVESMRCLDLYGGTDDGCYILQSLLQNTELDAGQADQVMTKAVGWLDSHPTEPRAFMVLPRLISRPDLPPRLREAATRVGLKWLTHFERTEQAAFVLRALLDRSELDAGALTTLQQTAARWSRNHKSSPHVASVTAALVRARQRAAHPDTDGRLPRTRRTRSRPAGPKADRKWHRD